MKKILIKKTKNTDIQFCRDCLHQTKKLSDLCGKCLSPRVINHKELKNLSIAHIDCDAFYASVEKRDKAEELRREKEKIIKPLIYISTDI